jgi:serine palmitoyltransferase
MLSFSFRKPGHQIIVNGKSCLNLATFNFLGFVGDKDIEV